MNCLKKLLGRFKKKPKPEVKPSIPPKEYDNLLQELVSVYQDAEIEAPKLKAITLAQWLLESGRATSKLSKEHYNFGGLKWRSEMKGYATAVSYEAHDGRTEYCKFEDVEKWIEGYWRFIDRDPYIGWRRYLTNPQGFMQHLVESGYCPDNGYIDKVFSLEQEAKDMLDGKV